jgi:hypothetical protein
LWFFDENCPFFDASEIPVGVSNLDFFSKNSNQWLFYSETSLRTRTTGSMTKTKTPKHW